MATHLCLFIGCAARRNECLTIDPCGCGLITEELLDDGFFLSFFSGIAKSKITARFVIRLTSTEWKTNHSYKCDEIDETLIDLNLILSLFPLPVRRIDHFFSSIGVFKAFRVLLLLLRSLQCSAVDPSSNCDAADRSIISLFICPFLPAGFSSIKVIWIRLDSQLATVDVSVSHYLALLRLTGTTLHRVGFVHFSYQLFIELAKKYFISRKNG